MKLFVKQGGDSVFSHKQGSTIAARLDRIPTHSFHTRLLGLVGGGMLIDNFDIYIAGSVLVVLLHSGWSTLSSNAAFVSATFAGMMIGTFAAGLIGDRYGRKLTFQINLAVFGLASIGAAAATNIDLLIAMRFICGVGLGAEIVTGYSTLAEFVPPQSRGKWLALLSMCSSCGLLTATLFSYLLIPIAGWRIMFAIPGVAALFVLWLRKAIPESPRWLEMRGRHAEADAIVCSIEDSARKTGATLASPAAFPMRTSESIWQLKFLRPLVLGTIMQVVLFTVLYALVAWLPTFLARQGMPINQSLKQSAIMALGGPVGAFVARLLADRLGRRKGIIFGSVSPPRWPPPSATFRRPWWRCHSASQRMHRSSICWPRCRPFTCRRSFRQKSGCAATPCALALAAQARLVLLSSSSTSSNMVESPRSSR
ncbi:MFS transporter [Paraburkholderia youngii]|uniref:MFS transporter n=1 Tax=Paraburkholderia youngii TaxID=2782701 RepID=UPI003D224729